MFTFFEDYNGTVGQSSYPGNCTTICCGNCYGITVNGNNLEGRRCSSVNNYIVGLCGNYFCINYASNVMLLCYPVDSFGAIIVQTINY